MFDKWISREEERQLPQFSSHREAREYFKSKYGRDFVIEAIEDIDGEDCYFCAVIFDWDAYNEMMDRAEKGLPLSGIKYIECKQPVQIMASGRVHIVH